MIIFDIIINFCLFFMNTTKKAADTMAQFPNDYEKNVKELKKKGITLPEVVRHYIA